MIQDFWWQGLAVAGVIIVLFVLLILVGWVHDWRVAQRRMLEDRLEGLRAETKNANAVYTTRAPSPHCDMNVLHAPGECVYCDNYPDFQAARIRDNINFTGKTNPNLKPCPATMKRTLERIERWPGNVAEPPEGPPKYTI